MSSEISSALLAEATRTATLKAGSAGVEIRLLSTTAEQAVARQLWDDTWPSPDNGTEATPNLVRALEHSGGYVSGAFRGDQLLGACLGWIGLAPGAPGKHAGPFLHSHMAAVVAGQANAGVGTALKFHQRQWALARGLTSVTWTFDPLVRRNARLNLVKLGAVGEKYLIDFYGEMSDALNAGDPTDRMLARWDVASDRVVTAAGMPRNVTAAGMPRNVTAAGMPRNISTAPPHGSSSSTAGWLDAGARVAVSAGADGPGLHAAELEAALELWGDREVAGSGAEVPALLIALPRDIIEIRHSRPDMALRWRLATRQALAAALEAGGQAVDVTNDGDLVIQFVHHHAASN